MTKGVRTAAHGGGEQKIIERREVDKENIYKNRVQNTSGSVHRPTERERRKEATLRPILSDQERGASERESLKRGQ